MAEVTTPQKYWKRALTAALVVGGVYTVFMMTRHYFSARIFTGDLFYIGGISFAMCTVPVFLAAWALLGIFGDKLIPPLIE